MTLPSTVTLLVDGRPIEARYLSALQSLEVEGAVRAQSALKMQFAVGQEDDGDWARFAERTFTPAVRLGVEVQVGTARQRLINGFLAEFKMNFNADPCQSRLELTAMDALEKLKRSRVGASHPQSNLQSTVTRGFQSGGGGAIQPPTRGVPNLGVPNPNRTTQMQPENDLEFLRRLADEANCEVYVEPVGEVSLGHFERLALDQATPVRTAIRVNQGDRTNVRNAAFQYDLSGPTVVEARTVDSNGRAANTVSVNLRDRVSERDKRLIGPPDFQQVRRLERHGRETQEALQALCERELERLSWVVIGKGEIDTATYLDVLMPYRSVEVAGVGAAFNGTYLVWKVTHSFTRDLYCQKFEVRRKLGVN